MKEKFILENNNSSAEVFLFGGMTTVEFMIGGKKIAPLYTNPWLGTYNEDPFLNNLKGDFFCLPFGSGPKGSTKKYPHGYSCNGVYEITQKGDSAAVISLEYPKDYLGGSIENVQRCIELKENRITFRDTVKVVSPVKLAIGIHPIFRLPCKPGAAGLRLPENDGIYTSPTAVDKSSIFQNNIIINNAEDIPLRNGNRLNALRLPLDADTEELLLLSNVKAGKISLDNFEENYSATMEWDEQGYANCLLWMSNKGRKFAPWNGRNLCLGIEPVTATFEGGELGGGRDIKTAYEFTPGTVCFWHSISVNLL